MHPWVGVVHPHSPASGLLTVVPGPVLWESEAETDRQPLLGGGGGGRGLDCSCRGVTRASRTRLVSARGGCGTSEDKLFHIVGRIQFPTVVGLGFLQVTPGRQLSSRQAGEVPSWAALGSHNSLIKTSTPHHVPHDTP